MVSDFSTGLPDRPVDDSIESTPVVVPAKSGQRCDHLYKKYQKACQAFEADPSAENKQNKEWATTDLFLDIQNMAKRAVIDLALKQGRDTKPAGRMIQTATDGSSTDVAQNVMLKIWQNLSQFKGESKFSTWVYTITRNEIIDSFRQEARRREVSLFDWKDYSDEYSGSQGDAKGAAPGSDHFEGSRNRYAIRSDSPLKNSDDLSEDSDANSGHARRPNQNRRHREMYENLYIADIDGDRDQLIAQLSPDDRALLYFKNCGYSNRAIAIHFKKKVRWVGNRYAKIKNLLG